MELNLSLGTMPERLEEFQRQSPKQFNLALRKGGIQFLTWTNNGTSKNSSAKPQIKTGFLRGSGSAFVGNHLVGISKGSGAKRGSEANQTDPNKTVSGKSPTQITWGYNAVYAHRRHEEVDAVTQIDGEAKWLEKHIEADRHDLWDFISVMFQKGMGM